MGWGACLRLTAPGGRGGHFHFKNFRQSLWEKIPFILGKIKFSALRVCFRYTKTPFHEKPVSHPPPGRGLAVIKPRYARERGLKETGGSVLRNAGPRGLNCSGLGLIVLNWAERNWSQGIELGWTGWRASNLDMAGGRGAGSSGHEATEECIRLVLAGAVVLWDLISPLGQLCPQAFVGKAAYHHLIT